jgi:hypothetical protein
MQDYNNLKHSNLFKLIKELKNKPAQKNQTAQAVSGRKSLACGITHTCPPSILTG